MTDAELRFAILEARTVIFFFDLQGGFFLFVFFVSSGWTSLFMIVAMIAAYVTIDRNIRKLRVAKHLLECRGDR